MFILAFLAALFVSAGQTASPQSPPSTQPLHMPLDQPLPGRDIYRQVDQLVNSGKYYEALHFVERGLKKYPDDYEVKRAFLDFHTAMAKQMIDREAFDAADRLIDAALKVNPQEVGVMELRRSLIEARSIVNERVAEALSWIDLELFDPAYVRLRQARALVPDRRKEWQDSFILAAIAAGDDYYFTHDFAEAYKRYDAVLQMVEHDEAPLAALRDEAPQALQCLLLPVAEQSNPRVYSDSRWKEINKLARLLLKAAAPDAKTNPDVAATIAVCEHLLNALNEHRAGNAAAALDQYNRAAATILPFKKILDARRAAVEKLTRLYSPEFSARRRGIWSRSDPPPDKITATKHFRLHARNGPASSRVEHSLEFQFDRVAQYFGRKPEDIPWTAPADVYLYVTIKELRSEAGVAPRLFSDSHIDASAGKLHEHAMYLCQADPMLLSTSVPHEIAHLMLAAITNYHDTPLVLREGIALHCEPDCRKQSILRRIPPNDRRTSAEDLLKVTENHPGPSTFVQESYGFVEAILHRGTIGDLIDFCATGKDFAGLPQAMNYDTLLQLDAYWRGSEAAQRQSAQQQKPPSPTDSPIKTP